MQDKHHKLSSVANHFFCRTDASAVRVTLNGNECEIDVASFSDTNIQCAVPAHTGTNAKPDVVVEIGSVRAVGVRTSGK